MTMTDNEITAKALGIARTLSYNDATAEAKHMLHELAHRLDRRCVRAKSTKHGLLLVDGRGRSRYATLRERWAYALARALPAEV